MAINYCLESWVNQSPWLYGRAKNHIPSPYYTAHIYILMYTLLASVPSRFSNLDTFVYTWLTTVSNNHWYWYMISPRLEILQSIKSNLSIMESSISNSRNWCSSCTSLYWCKRGGKDWSIRIRLNFSAVTRGTRTKILSSTRWSTHTSLSNFGALLKWGVS